MTGHAPEFGGHASETGGHVGPKYALGHAFGLDHIPIGGGAALMNPVLASSATVPTQTDVKALVSALDRSISGARPGDLEYRQAEGLQAPSDWSAAKR